MTEQQQPADAATYGAGAFGATVRPQQVALFAGNLAPTVTEADLHKMFEEHSKGSVSSTRIAMDNVTRESLGHGYVNFHDPTVASEALENLNCELLHGRPIRLMWATSDKSKRNNPDANVFVKGVAPVVNTRDLYELCTDFGEVVSVKLSTKPDGTSRGFGFVQFSTVEAADKAIATLNGGELENSVLHAEKYRPRSQRGTAEWTNVYMKNVPHEWDEETLRQKLTPFGEITSMLMEKDAETKAFTGVAFVNFATHEAARKAVAELDGVDHEVTFTIAKDGEEPKQVTQTKQMYVARAQSKSERSRRLAVQRAEAKRQRIKMMQECNLHVANLDEKVDEAVLQAKFSEFGAITNCKVERKDGKHAGFGYVCYDKAESAAKAMQNMQGSMLEGKQLKVNMWQPKAMREAARQERNSAYPQANAFFNAQRGMPGMFGNMPPAMINQQAFAAMYGMAAAMPDRAARGRGPGMQGFVNYPQLANMQQQQMMHYMQQQQQPQFAQQQQYMQPQQQQPQYGADPGAVADATLTKQDLGSELFAKISALYPQEASKLTGMMLEAFDMQQVQQLLQDDAHLRTNVDSALQELQK